MTTYYSVDVEMLFHHAPYWNKGDQGYMLVYETTNGIALHLKINCKIYNKNDLYHQFGDIDISKVIKIIGKHNDTYI